MNRTYKLKHLANKGKQMKVIKTVRAYRDTAALIARDQWRCFYESARPFNKQCDIKHIGTQLSERFKQTCQYQVVGTLDSFISNRQNDFVYHIHRSAFNEDTKHRMFTVNKYELWYNKYLFSVMFVTRKEKKGKRSKDKEYIYTVKHGLTIEPEDLKLSRKILNHILSKHRRPSFRRVNMNLDNKVAVIAQKTHDKAKTFDYWLRLSTCEKGKPVHMPVESNKYFDSITATTGSSAK